VKNPIYRTKLGKISADKIDDVVFASEFAKNYVAKSWRNTVKNLSLSLQLIFAPQEAKAAELFVIKLLSKRLYLRKITTIIC